MEAPARPGGVCCQTLAYFGEGSVTLAPGVLFCFVFFMTAWDLEEGKLDNSSRSGKTDLGRGEGGGGRGFRRD